MAIEGDFFAVSRFVGCEVAGCADGGLGEDNGQGRSRVEVGDLAHVVHAEQIVVVAVHGGRGRVVAGPRGLGRVRVRQAEYLERLE